MSRKNKKYAPKRYTPDVLAVGALAFAGSAAVQRLLLQPKTELKISERLTLHVSGLMPFSQKYIAAVSRKAFNDVLPVVMSGVVKVCEAIKLREQLKRFTVWFLYDLLGRYSLHSVFGFFADRLKVVDRSRIKAEFETYVRKIIMEKEDRDEIIRSVTVEIVRLMRLVTEGTMAALLFNERFAEAASGTVSAAINRFLSDDAPARLTDYVFTFLGRLEGVTLAGLLTDTFKIGRADMAEFIESTYNALLGPNTAQSFKEMHLGDVMYDMISTVDYNQALDVVNMRDLIKIDVSSAFTAMSIYSASKRAARKFYKHRNRVAGVVSGVAALFTDREFLEEPGEDSGTDERTEGISE